MYRSSFCFNFRLINGKMDEEDIFYFESDHLALRGNKDYCDLLKIIAILNAQKIRVLRELEDLEYGKKLYSENPTLLLEKIKRKENLMPANYSTEIKIPTVDYFKQLKYEFEVGEKLDVKEEDDNSVASNVTKVRGRVMDENKPETYNQLWTFEEQRRLEQLLVEYPAEDVEMRRFAKIAKALGNRTVQQVSSRVRKYFQKLYDAGLPIPGRKPKNRRIGYNKPKLFHKPSTFFPAFNVPVQMTEDDDLLLNDIVGVPSPPPAPPLSEACDTSQAPVLSPDSLELNKFDPKKRKIAILKAIRDEKQNVLDGYDPDPLASKCVKCMSRSISRTCWYCHSCMVCLNLCVDCLVTQLLENKFEHLMHEVEINEEV